MKKFTLILSLFLIAVTLFTACKKEYDSIENIDSVEIQAYIQKNNLTGMIPDPEGSGFYYQVLEPGTGAAMANKDWILFNYQYKSLKTGQVFYNTSVNSNASNFLGYLASPSFPVAFRKALLGQNYGAKLRIIIPSHMAFGKNGSTPLNIGSNEIIDATISTYATNLQSELDNTRIVDFLSSKGLTAVNQDRVYTINVASGAGTSIIDEGSVFKVKYTGRLLDGTVFDSSTDGTFSTTIAGVISGWKVLNGHKEGDKIRIFIPSDLGYGTTGSGSIPPNAVLDFDIEVTSVEN